MAEGGIMCEKCNKPTQRIVPPSNPEAGEDYCHKCHKSYPHNQKIAEGR